MIGLFADPNSAEARRIHEGLLALGCESQWSDKIDVKGVWLADADRLAAAPGLSRHHTVIAFGGENDAAAARSAFRHGAFDYLPAGTNMASIQAALDQAQNHSRQDIVSSVEQSQPLESARGPDCDFDCEPKEEIGPANYSGNAKVQQLYEIASKVSLTDISVMISGPSGAGKEVLAKFIHNQSPRRSGPYVALNCAAIPESILEATLFGHTKGAFTGASEARVGKFEQANGGTLLLDEITEMPIGLQAKLLRVLQEREIERLGSNQSHPVDVRIIAATNRNPKEAVAAGLLREDLFYRLNVFPLSLPKLAERPEDIIPLAQQFLTQYAGSGKSFSPAAQSLLLNHEWPGNVRELENCVQRSVVLAEQDVVDIDALLLDAPDALGLSAQDSHAALMGSAHMNDSGLAQRVKSHEEAVLLESLAANNGVRKTTAQALGISERTLRHKLAALRERGVLV